MYECQSVQQVRGDYLLLGLPCLLFSFLQEAPGGRQSAVACPLTSMLCLHCAGAYTRGPVMGFPLILAIFHSDGSCTDKGN